MVHCLVFCTDVPGFQCTPLAVVRMGINHFCFFPVNLMHLFNCMHALLLLTGLCFLMLMPSCAPSSSVPWFCPFGQHTLMCTNHTRFSKPHQLFAVRVCGPSASPTSVEVCGGARRMCESQVGPMSFGWSQIDDGRMVG